MPAPMPMVRAGTRSVMILATASGTHSRVMAKAPASDTALDINPDENYQCKNDGTAMVGSYWKPGVDPYSIPSDGIVVKTFNKYGFRWGGTFNSSKDYMHFSYFGT